MQGGFRLEGVALDGQVIVTEVPDEPISAESIETAVPSLKSLAAALQVTAERVGLSKPEVKRLVRPPGDAALAERT